MSWFKKPVEYRSYSDGSYEIIERRSLLRIGAAVLGLSATIAGGAFVVPKVLAPEADKVDVPPAIIVLDVIQKGDRASVYQILTQYDRLERIGRSDFWAAATALGMVDLLPFAEHQQAHENDPVVLENLELAITTLSAMQRTEKR